MIPDALLYVVRSLLDAISAILPDADLTDWPLTIPAMAADIGARTGPINQFFPIAEMFTYLAWMLLVWWPAVLVFQVTAWVYRHLPVVGAG
jgi:hypothetical protein